MPQVTARTTTPPRKDAQDEWVLDALVPVGSPEVVQGNVTSLHEREELFGHSAF